MSHRTGRLRPAILFVLLALSALAVSPWGRAADGVTVLIAPDAEAPIAAQAEKQWTVESALPKPPALPVKEFKNKAFITALDRGLVHEQKGGAVLSLKARSQADRLAGMGSMLLIRVNGRLVTEERLMNRPLQFETPSGKTMESARKGFIYHVYHSPDFKPIPESYKYYPLGIEPAESYTFRFNVSDMLVDGENTITIENKRSEEKGNTLFVQDVTLAQQELDDVLLEEAQRVEAERTKMLAALQRLYDDIPPVKDTAETKRVLENLRMSTWGTANASLLTEFEKPEDAADNAQRIKNDNATVAIIRGRHFRLNYLDETERLMKFYKTTAKACHDAGITPFCHFDFTMFAQPGYGLISQHPDWLQVSLSDGAPHHWCCINNPEFREKHISYVEEIVRQGIEGFMLDEINFSHKWRYHCGCKHCRQDFEKMTGYRIPEYWDEGFLGDTSDPLWRLWSRWQAYSLTKFKSEMLARLRKINPNVVILMYSTNVYFPARSTSEVLEQGRVCFAGTEGTNVTYAGYANLFAQHRICAAMQRRWGRPTWAQYPTSLDGGREFASAWFATIVGNQPWGWRRAYEGKGMRDAFNWEYLEESYTYGDPVADVAVLLATVNRWGPTLDGVVHSVETSGWIQGLGLRGAQIEPVPSLHMRDDDLTPYKAVVIPHPLSLPRPSVDKIARYVDGGGVAVVTGVPGRYDDLGFPLGAEALHRRMGIRAVRGLDTYVYNRYKGTLHNGAPGRLTLKDGVLPGAPRTIDFGETYWFEPVFAGDAKAEVLATRDGGKPAIWSIPSGKGRYIYVGFLPGTRAYQHRMRKGAEDMGYLDPTAMDLARAIAREATGDRDAIAVEGDGLLTSSWRKGDRMWVRMLNIQGARLKEGENVNSLRVHYPDLSEIRVVVQAPVKAEATLLSPDLDAPLPLKLDGSGERRTIVIPPNTFRRYAFIRLEVQ